MAVFATPTRLFRLNIMLIEKNHDVMKPMATVPMMAIGTILSGLGTSSAMCVAQSRHANAQFALIRPTIKAMPDASQPVWLIKVAKTNLAVS